MEQFGPQCPPALNKDLHWIEHWTHNKIEQE